jgi:hypothetical protein
MLDLTHEQIKVLEFLNITKEYVHIHEVISTTLLKSGSSEHLAYLVKRNLVSKVYGLMCFKITPAGTTIVENYHGQA